MHPSMRRMLLLAATLALPIGCHAVFGLTDYEVGTGAGTATATGTAGTATGAGTGGGGVCATPADCPGDDTTCSYRTCEASQCGMATAPRGTPCDEDGGQWCDGTGSCVECNEASDCDDGEDCQQNQCVSQLCGNSVQDQDETDVDCGGSCPPCANGLGCLDYEDCASRLCVKSGGAGGAGGAGATLGICTACTDDASCASTPDSWCDPSTAGGTCQDDLTGGQDCDRDAQCATGFCAVSSQVCCDSACGAACEGCLASETGGTDGVCGTITACSDCDTQYGSAGAVYEVCDATQSDCVLRITVNTDSCATTCQNLGGECLSAVNDEPNGSCTPSTTETFTCSTTGWTSILCTCSNGCGTGPPCTSGQVCTSGTCN